MMAEENEHNFAYNLQGFGKVASSHLPFFIFKHFADEGK